MIRRSFVYPIDAEAERAMAGRAALRLITDPSMIEDDEDGCPLFYRDRPASEIVDIQEVDSHVVQELYDAEHVYEVQLNDGSWHEIAWRGETEAVCLTHPQKFCVACARTCMFVAIQKRRALS